MPAKPLALAISTRDILEAIPDSWRNLLVQDGQDVNYRIWRWGDMANKIIGLGAPAMLTYAAVAEVVGKRRSSIRNYAYIARTFPPAVREEYGVLSIEHFKEALKYDRPTDVLEYAVKVAEDRGGRPASVDECRAFFKITGPLVIADEEPEVHDYDGKNYPGFAIPIMRRIRYVKSSQERRKLEKVVKSLIWRIDHAE